MTTLEFKVENGWVIDQDGNRASIGYWGGEAEARKSLEGLRGCSGCSNCSRCSDCSDCSNCSGCSDCSNCSRCSGCSRCSDCSRCSGCSGKKEKGRGFPEVPIIPKIHQAVYKAVSQPGAFDMGNWHGSCGTTHCRGGWTVHLAGEKGYALERATSPLFAAQQIYKASGYRINPSRFFDSNEESLADMKRLAEEEKKSAKPKRKP